MRKFRTIIALCLIAAMAAALAACGGHTYTFTMIGNKNYAEVKEASDGDTADYEALELGKNRVVKITSSLDKGELQMEFIEAVNTKVDVDDIDSYTLFDTAATITVGPGDEETVELERGDYVVRFTAIGDTNGRVDFNIEKK